MTSATPVTPAKELGILIQLVAELVGPDGFELQPGVLGRTPDAAVRDLRIAFQADGDYWHGPNSPEGNKRSDADFNVLFLLSGWDVVRVWESTLKRQPDIARNLLTGAIQLAREAQHGGKQLAGPPIRSAVD